MKAVLKLIFSAVTVLGMIGAAVAVYTAGQVSPLDQYIESEGKIVHICVATRRYVLQTPDQRMWLHMANTGRRHTQVSKKDDCL